MIVPVVLVLIIWFGFVAQLLCIGGPELECVEISLCGVNITDQSSSYIAYAIDFGVFNPTITDIVIPSAYISMVADDREPEAVPLDRERGVRKSVDYGALLACELIDVTMRSGHASDVRMTCALSQYSFARTELSRVVNAMIAGEGGMLYFSTRYEILLGLFGLPPNNFTGGRVFKLNPNSTEDRQNATSDARQRFNDQHCRAANGTSFDWRTLITGNSIGFPENMEEIQRLVHLCGLALCERHDGIEEDDASPAGLLAPPGSDLPPIDEGALGTTVAPLADRIATACGRAMASRMEADGHVGTRLALSLFNPVAIKVNMDELGVAIARSPTTAVWDSQAGAASSVAVHGAVLACSAPQGSRFKGATWTQLELDCVLGPELTAVASDYRAGLPLNLSAASAYAAGAFGVSFSGETTTPWFEISKADASGEFFDDAGRPEYMPVPELPSTAEACAGLRASLAAVDESCGNDANATLAALHYVLRELLGDVARRI